MKDKLSALKLKLKSPAAKHLALCSTGVVVGSAVTMHCILRSPRTLILPKEAYEALINDETNFVRFSNPKHEHAFRVILEQWI
jgi:hypothetical protein